MLSLSWRLPESESTGCSTVGRVAPSMDLNRHEIFHRRPDIVHVKLFLLGVKCWSDRKGKLQPEIWREGSFTMFFGPLDQLMQ